MSSDDCVPELVRLADARDLRGLAAWLTSIGEELPNPERLYRGLGLDDNELEVMLDNLAAGQGVQSLETYSPDKLADFSLSESLAHGSGSIRALFGATTPQVEAALRRLESAIADLKRLLRADVARRLATEPALEQRLLNRVAKSYILGEIPPYLQSAVRGGADGAGSGCALLFAIEKGLKQGKHPVVVEFDHPASGTVEVGVYPETGIHEFVVLGDIPNASVRALWVGGRRFVLNGARAMPFK